MPSPDIHLNRLLIRKMPLDSGCVRMNQPCDLTQGPCLSVFSFLLERPRHNDSSYLIGWSEVKSMRKCDLDTLVGLFCFFCSQPVFQLCLFLFNVLFVFNQVQLSQGPFPLFGDCWNLVSSLHWESRDRNVSGPQQLSCPKCNSEILRNPDLDSFLEISRISFSVVLKD